MIGQTISHYEIIEKLGAGGMGAVYLARDRELDRRVALKVLPPEVSSDVERLRRFVQEAKAASALNHPNIATVYEVGKAGEVHFMAMEYVDGRTLNACMAERSLTVPEIIDIAIALADALDAAHERGITHRDIKPGNIMINSRGQVKLLDFGLAKVVPQASAAETTAGIVMGTVQYMSPEQGLGRDVDHRSDIFSLAIVLYEAATGRLPFSGSTATETIHNIATVHPEAAARFNYDVPSELERIIGKCLEKDRSFRYQTSRELLVDLKSLKRRPAPGSPPKWNTGILTLVAMAVLGFLFFGGLELSKRMKLSAPGIEASSVVVLPAKVLGASDLAFLADAVPSTLSTLLGQVGGLDTKMPPSTIEFEKVQNDLARLAEIYGVKVFLVPTVTAQADELVLNLQAVDPRSRRQLWTGQFQGSRGNYNELLRRAADGAGRALKPGSTVSSVSKLAKSSDAELAYQRGVFLFNRYNYEHRQGDFNSAFETFQTALKLDPTLANAAGRIAWLYIFKDEALDSFTSRDAAVEIDKWAKQALAIDPSCGIAYAAMGAALDQTGPAALKAIEYGLKAASSGPDETFAVQGLATISNVSTTLAIEVGRQAYKHDPLYLYAQFDVARHLRQLGRASEGLALLNEILRVEPNNAYTLIEKAMILTDLDRADDAAEILASAPAKSDISQEARRFHTIGLLTVALAQKDAAGVAQAVRQAEMERVPEWSYWDKWDDVYAVLAYAEFGQPDRALATLQALEKTGFIPPYDWLMIDARLDALRKDRRFRIILDRSRAQFLDLLKLLDEAKARGEFPPYFEKPLAELRVRLGL